MYNLSLLKCCNTYIILYGNITELSKAILEGQPGRTSQACKKRFSLHLTYVFFDRDVFNDVADALLLDNYDFTFIFILLLF